MVGAGDSNLIVVLFMRDLVKSTLLANSTPSLKRSCDVDSIQNTIAQIPPTNFEPHDVLRNTVFNQQ